MMGSVRQFFVYSLIGFLNTAVHFVVFMVLFRFLGLPILVASAIGYAAGVANSYFMNRTWTFAVATRANTREFSRFVLVNVAALLLNLAALQYLTVTIGLMPELGQVGAIVASLAANFAGNKWWAFRKGV